MDFTYLRTFCEVAKCGNYTRAAEALGYAQSSVTTHLRKLEEQYGAVLFERRGRRMHPTQAGEALLPYAQQILALNAEAKVRLAEQQTGTLTIATIETLAAFYLPPVLRAMREAYPRLTIALRPGTEASIIQAVRQGECDLGLILDRVVAHEELVCVPLRKEELAVVTQTVGGAGTQADAEYGTAEGLSARDLTDARLLLTEEGCTYRAVLLEALRQAGAPYQVIGEFGSLETIKQCVMGGLGVAFLPQFAVRDEVAQGTLRAIPYAGPSDLYTQAIHREKKWRSRAFEHVLKLISHVARD
jgi:DNA-binding transcriptional LysR family regulator